MLTAYPIAQIQQVEFSINRTTHTKGCIGHFRIVQRNGKRSMSFNFSSKLSLNVDSQAELNQYIEQLQQQLAQHGIHSILKK